MVLLGCDVGDGVASTGFGVGVGDNGDDIYCCYAGDGSNDGVNGVNDDDGACFVVGV